MLPLIIQLKQTQAILDAVFITNDPNAQLLDKFVAHFQEEIVIANKPQFNKSRFRQEKKGFLDVLSKFINN